MCERTKQPQVRLCKRCIELAESVAVWRGNDASLVTLRFTLCGQHGRSYASGAVAEVLLRTLRRAVANYLRRFLLNITALYTVAYKLQLVDRTLR